MRPGRRARKRRAMQRMGGLRYLAAASENVTAWARVAGARRQWRAWTTRGGYRLKVSSTRVA